jgi:hypothetical protein
MGWEPPTHTYTPEEYEKLIDSYINECKSGKTLANPATLRLHLKLSKEAISSYRNRETHKAYKAATERAYDFMESEGWQDLSTGKGTYGSFILGRVMKYSEKQEIDQNVKATVKMGTVKVNGQELKLET